MTELDELRRRLVAAAPAFEPVAPARIRGKVRRRRLGAAAVGVTAVLTGAAVLVPRLALDPAPPAAPATAAATATARTPATSAAGSRTCPPPNPNGIVDYVSFVVLGGTTYVQRDGLPGPRPVVGDPVGTVRCTLEEIQPGPGYQGADGDAAFLPAGTTLHATPGIPVSFRVVTADGTVFEARGPRFPRVGADLLPPAGLVSSIEVVRPGRPPHRLVDPAAVMAGLLRAPVRVGRSWEATGQLRFWLTDGTATVRGWAPADGIVEGGIVLPLAVVRALDPG